MYSEVLVDVHFGLQTLLSVPVNVCDYDTPPSDKSNNIRNNRHGFLIVTLTSGITTGGLTLFVAMDYLLIRLNSYRGCAFPCLLTIILQLNNFEPDREKSHPNSATAF